jgi:hypothetical protein
MISELQFAGIAAFLVWCLLSSLCGVVSANPAGPRAWLIWRERGPAGWSPWREVHFGLSAADRRILFQTEPVLDRSACGALVDTVLQQTPLPESDAVQFAILRAPPDTGEEHNAVVFVSDVYSTGARPIRSQRAQAEMCWPPNQVAAASASPSVDASLETQAT